MMKKLLLILMSIIVFMTGCDQKKEVEIIPDYNSIYLPISEVDTPIEILGDTENQLEEVLKLISATSKPKTVGFYFFESQMFVNENGELEKIGFKKIVPLNFKKEGELNYNADLLFEKLTEYLAKLEFSAAIKDGNSVKSQYEWEGSFRVDTTGLAEVYLGALAMNPLKKSFNLNPKDYAEIAEEMPSPVGGIKAIAENVVYPEIAKRAGIEGRVYVKAYINEEGMVVGTEILKGIGGGCDQAAITAVVNTVFTPGRKDGKPVKVQVSIPIMFKLN
jgi:TonB family protein